MAPRKGSREQRAARRKRAFTQRKPGRPRGQKVPLRESTMAWETVVFALLTQPGSPLYEPPIRAAEFAATVFNESVRVESITKQAADGEEIVGVSFVYTGGRGVKIITTSGKTWHDPEVRYARENRRDKILREAPRLIAGASGDDLIWLQLAMQALLGLFVAIALGDGEAFHRSTEVLASPLIGFPPVLKKLFPILMSDQEVRIQFIDQ